MSDRHDGNRDEALPSSQPIRTVGQRRREAEVKLEQHLEEARHKDDHHDTAEPAPGTAASEDVDGGDVAAIQNDDRLTAADRMDLIANQVIPEQDEGR
ncbi:hypothetical protein ACFVYC_09095 [Pseudarthrobacter sp. NPDC058329]|uniref:hypothetical protein n=1 Tax=Pseudarthrobacter sp. NPDC058329 TaxID=3346448 RepID=UPI0036DF4D06